ncbi:hypothetical protein [Clostridium thermarum]|uniref:hypothetical protein n=1 Tax=Clostridium thermarum TaxID=1716543 RepID=UPI0013D1E11E|nr:hypothetical protein [Clostridium thermarum]
MKKPVLLILFILLTALLLLSCSSQKSGQSPQEPPEITVTIGKKEMKYVIGKNQWNGAKYDREDTFKTALKETPEAEIPLIVFGETAVIDFKNLTPDKFTINDILIDSEGNMMYTSREIQSIPVEFKKGKVSFEIKLHPASFLSSFYVKDRTDLRGFRMTADWGENQCEYAFIIKTKVN